MPEERRSVNDLSGSNLGDYSARDAAGRDIIHQGLDPSLLRYLEGERNSRDALAAIVIDVRKEIADLRKEALTTALDAAMERAIDFDARHARQALADQRDAATAQRLADIDRRILWLTVGLVAFAIVVVALVARESGLLALRATFDTLALSR